MVICTLGDLLLDVVVRLERPLVTGDDVVAEIATAPGGQAANAAAWAAALGADARFVGRRGGDEAGQIAAVALASHGVELRGPAEGRNGIVVSMVDPDGVRSMASDRGVSPSLAPEDLEADWFADCEWLHIAGYSLLREPIASASLAAVAHARRSGARVSVDLSTATAIAAFGGGRFRSVLAGIEPDVVFGTAAEFEALDGAAPAPEWVVKRGAEGIVVATNGSRRELAAFPADVVDSTGAGDALAAGYLLGGAELALYAAASCVQQVGAMPVTATTRGGGRR